MTILCLTTGASRIGQANYCFVESVKLGLDNIQIIEEIGDLYQNLAELD
jgi:hypothetical protein